MARILTVTANTLIDYLTRAPLVRGQVNRVERFVPTAGGKGMNSGRLLASLGHKVVGIGFAGGASGELLRDLIALDGVEPSLTETRARTRIGFQVIGPDGVTTAALENGFRVELDEVDALIEEVRQWLPETDLVLIGGSVPHPNCNELYARLLEACAEHGVECWLDGYGPAMLRALSGGSFLPRVVTPNREEHGDGSAFRGCPEIHLTDGPRAVRVRSPEGSYLVTPPAVLEVNPIGSGDCYLAALAHARLSGMCFEEQLRFAVAAGAANATRGDVARVSLQDIEPYIDRVSLRELPG